MININVKEFKVEFGGKKYTFRLDFRALLKLENRYGAQSTELFNDFLRGKETYANIVKILSCACAEKEFTEDELAGLLSFDFRTMKLIDEVTLALVEGLIKKSEPKNAEASQSSGA